MQKGRIPRNAFIGVVALGAAFWAGRTTSSSGADTVDESKRIQRSSSRGNERSPVRTLRAVIPGDGANPVENAQALRDIFKSNGGMSGEIHAKEALSHMNAKQIAALGRDLIASQAETPGYGYYAEITTTFSRWAELDPDAALEFAMATKQRSARTGAMNAVFATLAKLDPGMARQKIDAIPDNELRKSAQSMALQTISAKDPDTWMAWVKENPSLANQWSMSSVVSEWAIDDPEATAARLKALPAKMVGQSLESLGKVWAGKDPAAARAWAESLEDPSQRGTALSAVIGGMAAKDPEAAFAAANALSPEDRAKALPEIFQTLGDLDFDSALSRISAMTTPEDKNLALQQLGQTGGWNSIEPAKLADFLEDVPKGESRSNILSQLGQRMAGATAAEMEQTLAAFSESDQTTIRERMVSSLSYQDPEKALTILAGMGDSPRKKDMLRQTISYLAGSDPAAAIRQLDQIPAGNQRQSTLSSISSNWARKDSTGAIKWAETLQGNERATAFQAIVPQLVQKDPAQAVKAFEKLAQGRDGSEDSRQQVANTAINLAANWANKDPEATLKWAKNLDDDQSRNQAIHYTISSWRRNDPDAARQAVDQLKLPEPERQQILRQFDQEE